MAKKTKVEVEGLREFRMDGDEPVVEYLPLSREQIAKMDEREFKAFIKDEAMSSYMNLRVQPSLYSLIEMVADDDSRSISDWIRMTLTNAALKSR